jgi:hypothetical protein
MREHYVAMMVQAVAQAIRDTPPCSDQAHYEAMKLVNGILAMQDATNAELEKELALRRAMITADSKVPQATVQDLVPPLEAPGDIGGGHAPEGELETIPAPPAVVTAFEAEADHEALEAARRQEQEAAIAAQLAEASPLDKTATGKGSKKAKISRLDGQDAGGTVSPLDLPVPAAAPTSEE